MLTDKTGMGTRSGKTKQDIYSEIDSWVFREANTQGVFESFPRDSLEKILNETDKKIRESYEYIIHLCRQRAESKIS